MGDIFGSVLAILQKNLDRDAAAGTAGIVGAPDRGADRVGPVRGHAERFAAIIKGDKFPLHRVPFDGEDARGRVGNMAHGRHALTLTGGISPASGAPFPASGAVPMQTSFVG